MPRIVQLVALLPARDETRNPLRIGADEKHVAVTVRDRVQAAGDLIPASAVV